MVINEKIGMVCGGNVCIAIPDWLVGCLMEWEPMNRGLFSMDMELREIMSARCWLAVSELFWYFNGKYQQRYVLMRNMKSYRSTKRNHHTLMKQCACFYIIYHLMFGIVEFIGKYYDKYDCVKNIYII